MIVEKNGSAKHPAKIDVKRAADRKAIIPFCPAQFNQRCWSERAVWDGRGRSDRGRGGEIEVPP